MQNRSRYLILALLACLSCLSIQSGHARSAAVTRLVSLISVPTFPQTPRSKTIIAQGPSGIDRSKAVRPSDPVVAQRQPDRTIKLSTQPASPQVDQDVWFRVEFPPDYAACRSVFTLSFGDGKTSAIGAELIPHQYSEAKTYFASVEINSLSLSRNAGAGDIKMLKTCSALLPPKPRPVKVQPVPPTPTPTPSITPPASPSPSPSPTPIASPSPSPTPIASPSPGATIASNSTPTPISSPSSTPFVPAPGPTWDFSWPSIRDHWWYLLPALLVPFVGYRALRSGFTPRPTVSFSPDAGHADVNDGMQPLSIDAEVILRPDIAEATYQITTDEPNLIRTVRRSNV